jgi:transcriptional regulator with XRE-family HTH domain
MAPPRRYVSRLGEALRIARDAIGIGQLDLARRIPTSARQVSRWENGLQPTPPDAARILAVFEQAPDEVYAMLARELGIELAEPEVAPGVAPAPIVADPAGGAAQRSTPVQLRASFDAIILSFSEDRDVLPRHLRAFAVELLRGAARLGVSTEDAATLLAAESPQAALPEDRQL